MRAGLAFAGFTALVLASAPSVEGADADRPRVALSVSPARLALTAPASRRISLRNDGAERVVVDVTRRTVSRQTPAPAWLQVVPARLVLRSGESRLVTLRLSPPGRAEPGDHHVLVLLTTRPLRGDRVNVQLRLGVRITMTVPGRILHNLTLGGLRVQRKRNARFLLVSVANRGNVTVELRGHVTGWLVRGRRKLARLNPRARRALLPGASTVVALRSSRRVRGLVIAVVQVRLGSGRGIVARRYRLRL